jgi:hypothetical protein
MLELLMYILQHRISEDERRIEEVGQSLRQKIK